MKRSQTIRFGVADASGRHARHFSLLSWLIEVTCLSQRESHRETADPRLIQGSHRNGAYPFWVQVIHLVAT